MSDKTPRNTQNDYLQEALEEALADYLEVIKNEPITDEMREYVEELNKIILEKKNAAK